MPALQALGIGAFLEELAFRAPGRAGGLAFAITLHLDGQPPTVAVSDGLAAGLAEAQAADDDGLGLSVARTGQAASIAGTADARQGTGVVDLAAGPGRADEPGGAAARGADLSLRHRPGAGNHHGPSSGAAPRRPTTCGAIFYTKLHNRLLRPLPAADQPQAPAELRAALRAIDQHIGTYIARDARTGVERCAQKKTPDG